MMMAMTILFILVDCFLAQVSHRELSCPRRDIVVRQNYATEILKYYYSVDIHATFAWASDCLFERVWRAQNS